jgi:hypothetical protein
MKKISPLLIAIPLLMMLPHSATARVNGAQSNVDVTVKSSAAWTVLSSKSFNTPNSQGACTLVGSADANNPNNKTVNNLYRFTLSLDNPNPALDGGCERALEFGDNANNNDEGVKQIASTCNFLSVAKGVHRYYWLARKATNASNLTVTDNSMTISCTDNAL